jgi:hypothetical protein
LARWFSTPNLEEAIFEHMNSYVRLSYRTFRVIMSQGKVIGMFDGLDELMDVQQESFVSEFTILRARYPHVPWSVSTRPQRLPKTLNLPVVTVPELTEREIREIRQSFVNTPSK